MTTSDEVLGTNPCRSWGVIPDFHVVSVGPVVEVCGPVLFGLSAMLHCMMGVEVASDHYLFGGEVVADEVIFAGIFLLLPHCARPIYIDKAYRAL